MRSKSAITWHLPLSVHLESNWLAAFAVIIQPVRIRSKELCDWPWRSKYPYLIYLSCSYHSQYVVAQFRIPTICRMTHPQYTIFIQHTCHIYCIYIYIHTYYTYIIYTAYVHNICNIGWKWCVPKIIPYCMVETSSKPPWTIRFPVPPMTSQRALLLAPSAELTTPPCSCQWLTQCLLQDLNDVQTNVGSFVGQFWGCFGGCFGDVLGNMSTVLGANLWLALFFWDVGPQSILKRFPQHRRASCNLPKPTPKKYSFHTKVAKTHHSICCSIKNALIFPFSSHFLCLGPYFGAEPSTRLPRLRRVGAQ